MSTLEIISTSRQKGPHDWLIDLGARVRSDLLPDFLGDGLPRNARARKKSCDRGDRRHRDSLLTRVCHARDWLTASTADAISW
jgi:hypothetical protein